MEKILIEEQKPHSLSKNKSLPDSVKLSDSQVVETVKEGSYHPNYNLGSVVTTNYGKGYIQEIVKTGSDSREVIVNYEDGTSDVVPIDFDNDIVDDAAESVLYSYATDMGYHGANNLIANANEDVLSSSPAITSYVKAAKIVYQAGFSKSASFEEAYKESGLSLVMPTNIANKFYQAGVMDRRNNNTVSMAQEFERNQEKVSSSKKVKKSKSEKSNKSYKTQNRETANTNDSKFENINIKKEWDTLSKRQKNEIKVVRMISKVTGIGIEFYESIPEENGNYTAPNGFFDRKTNIIHLDINAGKMGQNIGETAILKTMSHELTHFIAKWSPDEFKNLKEFVFDKYTDKTGKTIDQLIKEKMESIECDRITAEEEVVSDACEIMLKDSKVIEQLAQNNNKLGKKIKNWIKEFFERIKKAFEGVEATSKEAKAMVSYMDELQIKWDNAFMDATNRFNNEETTGIELNDKNSYPYNMQTVIQEYIDSVNEIIKNAYEAVQSGNRSFHRYHICKVSDKQVRDFKKLTGVDIKGYTNNINTNGFEHISNRHGINGEHDNSMAHSDDVARIQYILENYDDAELLRNEDTGEIVYSTEFRDFQDKPAKMVKLEKKIDGTYYCVITVADNNYHKLWVVSAYIEKRVTQAIDVQAPISNVRNAPASPLGDSISSNLENVNQNNSINKLSQDRKEIDNEENIILLSERFDENDDIRYQLRGWNKYGEEVYETSEEVKNMTYREKASLYNNMFGELYNGERITLYDKDGNDYEAEMTIKLTRDKNHPTPNKKNSSQTNRLIAKLSTEGDLRKVLEGAVFDRNGKDATPNKNNAHKNLIQWKYYTKNVVIDGEDWKIVLSVRDTPNGLKVYEIKFSRQKNGKSETSLVTKKVKLDDEPNGHKSLSNTYKIAQEVRKSNREVSDTLKQDKLDDPIKKAAEGLGYSPSVFEANYLDKNYEEAVNNLIVSSTAKRTFFEKNVTDEDKIYKDKISFFFKDESTKELLNNCTVETLIKNEKFVDEIANSIRNFADNSPKFVQTRRRFIANEFAETVEKAKNGDKESISRLETELKIANGETIQEYDESKTFSTYIEKHNNEFKNYIEKLLKPIYGKQESILNSFRDEVSNNIEKYVERAEKEFGITNDFSKAAYLDINGNMIDFSNGGTVRGLDHRGISEILDTPEGVRGTEALIAFMNGGNIRMIGEGIDICTEPNDKQWSVLREFFVERKGEVYIDFSNKEGKTVGNIRYSKGTLASKIINDMKNYFETGVIPKETYNPLANYLFSLRNVEPLDGADLEQVTLIRENNELKKQNELLKKQFEVTKGHKPKIEDVQKIGRKILKEFNSTYSMEDFTENFKNIIDLTSESKFSNYEATMDGMRMVAQAIVNQSEYVDDEFYNQYAELRKSLRNTRIMLNPEQMQEVEYKYGSYNDFRKSLFGKVRIVKENGVQLDSLWHEYSNMYPELFNIDVSDVDQIYELMDIIDNIKEPKIIKGMEMDSTMAANDLAQRLFQEYFSLPSVQTFADARIHELNNAREEYKQNLKEARDEYKAKYEKRVYKDKIVRLRNNLAAKITKKKNIPLGLADKLMDVLNEIYRGNMNLGHVERVTQRELVKIGISQDVAKRITDKCTQVFLEDNKESVGRSEMRLEKWFNDNDLDLNKVELRNVMNTVHDNYFSVAAVNKTEKAFHSRLKALQETYAQFKGKDVTYEWSSEYDERLDEKLKEIVNITEDKAMVSLDHWQLEQLYNSLKEVSHIIVEAQQQISKEQGKANQEVAQKVINEVDRQNGKKKAHSINVYAEKYLLNDVRYIKSLTGYNEESQLYQLFDELFKASRVEDKFRMDATKPFDELTGLTKEYDNFTGKTKGSLIEDAIYDINGNPVAISHSQLVQIIMSWERMQGRHHMEKGGLTIYDAKEMLKGDLVAARDKSKRTVAATEKGIEVLKTYLTDYDKKWIQCAKVLFNQVSQDATNEVSMATRGVPLATAKNYIRLYVDDNFVKTESAAVKLDATLQGHGSLKATTMHAPQPLRIIGIEKCVKDNIDFSSRYYAYTIPIRNLRKILNYTMPGGTQSVAQSIQDVYGSQTYSRLVQIVDEIETGKSTISVKNDELQKKFDKLHSNFVAAALNTNMSVSIKQFASYPTAMAYIDTKNLTKALFGRVDLNEIDEHTGAHYKRRLGLSHIELEVIQTSSKLQDVLDRLPRLLNGRSWITAVDCFTTAKLWDAAKYQINDEIRNTDIQKDSKEYWEMVTNLYNKVLEETQPMYAVQYRTPIQKSNNIIARTFSMFKTQPLQTFGMIYDAYGEYRVAKENYSSKKNSDNRKKLQQAKKRFVMKAVPALINSAAAFSLMTLAANFAINKTNPWRDDETGELDILANLPGNYINSLISMIAPIGGSELYEAINSLIGNGTWYDIESPSLAMINDAYKAIKSAWSYGDKIVTGKEEFTPGGILKQLENIAFAFSPLFGLETKNVVNILKADVYYIGKIFGNQQIEKALGYQFKNSQLSQSFYNAVESGNSDDIDKYLKLLNEKAEEDNKNNKSDEVKNAYDVFSSDTKKQLKKQLYSNYYNAIKSGNDDDKQKYKNALEKLGAKYDSIDNEIKKLLIKNDERIEEAAKAYFNKDYQTYEKLVGEVSAEGFKNDVVIKAIKNVVNDMSPDEDDENTDDDGKKLTYSIKDMYNAMLNGDKQNYNHIREYLINNKKDYDEKKAKSDIKKQLHEDYKNRLLTKGTVDSYLKNYLDMSELDVYETHCNWDDKGIYNDLAESIKNGNMDSAKSYMELLYNRGKGKSIDALKSGIASELKGEFIYNYYSGGNWRKLGVNVLTAMDYMGVDIEQYEKTIMKWPSSAEAYNIMNAAIASGNVSEAQAQIYNLYYNQGKKKETIMRNIESTYKPLYVYMKKNNINTTSLENTLLTLAVYLGINKDTYKSKMESWK